MTKLKALTLVINKRALDSATWSNLEAQFKAFSKDASDGNDCSYNFYEATYGQESIEMGKLSLSLQT